MWVTLYDVVTGVAKACPDCDLPVKEWTDGDWSCDCNRALLFDPRIAEALDAQQHAAAPGMPEVLHYCYGEERFYVVDVAGDLEGMTKANVIAACNQDYPGMEQDHGRD